MSRFKSQEETHRDDEEDEVNEDGDPWFYVNQNGFPIDDPTWERMWQKVAKLHPEGLKVVENIRNSSDLPEQPISQAPVCFTPSASVSDKLEAVQDYMKQLQYPLSGNLPSSPSN